VGTRGGGNIPRAVSRPLPATREAFRGLRIPDPEREGRLPVLLQALRLLRERWGDSILLCGRAPAPFSCLCLACGMEAAFLLLHDDPGLAREAIRRFTEQQAAVAHAQVRSGAHAIWVGDCPASSRFIAQDHYLEHALEPARELVEAVRADGAISIYFAAENSLERLDAMAGVGADILGLGESVELEEAQRRLHPRCVMGNIDPLALLCRGTPEAVGSRVRQIRERVSPRGGHLFNTAEGIPRDAPEENVRAMIRAIHGTAKA